MRFLSKISDKYRRHLIMATMLVAILPSCIKEDFGQEGVENETIRFEILDDNWNQMQSKSLSSVHPLYDSSITDTLFLQVSTEDMATRQTKGSPVTTEKFHHTMGISAYRYKGSWTEELTPDFIYNEIVKEEDGWTTGHRWPGSAYNIRFFAYAPYGCEGLTLSGKDHAGSPQLTYVVPSDVQNQTDLVAAATGELAGNSNADAGISFSHILTALRIVTADDILPGTISEITLKNVYGAGTYSYATGSWEPSDNTDFTISREIITDGTADQALADGEYTFMMIPQILPAEAELNITFKEKATSTTHNLTASIAGIDFPTGQTVTFRISTSSITLEPTLEVTMPEFTHEGGTLNFSVRSFATVTSAGSSETIAMSWEASFVEEDGNGGYVPVNQPDWITEITFSDKGSSTIQEFSLTVLPQELTHETPHDDALKAAEPVSGIFDLSTNGGTEAMSTANCYVVNAPGTYSFPLVYGNAIKNGTPNQSAYIQPLSQKTAFTNHRNAAITDPYIYNNTGCVPDNAILSWQDAPGLISNIRLNSDKTEVLFDVNAETIKQGNAVVSVRDASNTIMWNWHIWVTDYNLGTDLTNVNTNSRSHLIMPNTIGFCYNPKEVYKEQRTILKLTQKNTNTIKYVEILQQGYSEEWGHATIYQWGVPCPMLPGSAIKNATGDDLNKKWYDADGIEHSENFPKLSGNSISNRIKNPVRIVSQFGNSYGSTSNMWNAALVYEETNTESYKTAETNQQIKTIYDPCPRNFTISPHYLLVHLTTLTTAQSSYKHYGFKTLWIDEEKTQTISIPSIPKRGPTSRGEIEDIFSYDYWSSYYRMHYSSTTTGCCDEYANPILAIKEQ